MAKRYGSLPHLFLKMDLQDFQFNMLSARLGVESEQKTIEKSNKRSRRGK